jgi:hypothetical protein
MHPSVLYCFNPSNVHPENSLQAAPIHTGFMQHSELLELLETVLELLDELEYPNELLDELLEYANELSDELLEYANELSDELLEYNSDDEELEEELLCTL